MMSRSCCPASIQGLPRERGGNPQHCHSHANQNDRLSGRNWQKPRAIYLYWFYCCVSAHKGSLRTGIVGVWCVGVCFFSQTYLLLGSVWCFDLFFFFHIFWTANSLIILSKPWPFLEIHIFKKYLLSANFVPRHLGLGMGERQTINIINK